MNEQTMGIILGVAIAIVVLIGVLEFLLFDYKQRKHDLSEYRMIVVGSAVMIIVGLIVKPFTLAAWAYLGSNFALFKLVTLEQWYLWPLALIVYEFFYWLQHYLGHKVRLFWCIHAPHHAPNSMNMMVGYNHSFIEGLFYFPFTLGFLPAVFGVDPVLIFFVGVIDTVWGSLLHLSDNAVKKRYGFLEKFLQTPSYHRAHHGKNLEYMDTNYNSITLFWDTVFGTKVVLRDDNPVIYGITSEVNTGSYMDVHFGQFKKLWADIKSAPTFYSKLAYIFMPPGWSHTGQHNTVSVQKQHAKELTNDTY